MPDDPVRAAPTLFDPIQLGAIASPSRILMAPMTRCRAGAGRAPTALNAEYYRQRASAGLIIAEATAVSPRGFGYADTPGIITDEQVTGWRGVTTAVHAAGGRIFLQLWHVGRISHPHFQPGGELPVAPSALRPRGRVAVDGAMVDYVTPRALELREISGVVAEYERGARLAKDAGFDGVEIHNANGYLPDQFLRDGTNRRGDAYGGPVENRARFTLEITEAVTAVWGADRVGIRFSPAGTFNDMHDSRPRETFGHVLRELTRFGLAYAHVTRFTDHDRAHGGPEGIGPRELRPFFRGPLISAGGFTRESATRALAEGWLDAAAFGVPFLANPDLPARFRADAPLNPPERATFYTAGPAGYTDYPALGANGPV